MARKPLNVGFTGDVAPEKGIVKKAKSTALKVTDEAGMVAAHAVDHPVATGSVVATVGVVAFVMGYMLGASSGGRRDFWLR